MRYKKLLTVAAFGLITAGMASADLFNVSANRPLAFVRGFRPDVTITNGEQTAAKRAAPLFDGDTLSTGQAGLALVQFMDKSIVKVQPNSVLIVQGTVQGQQDVTTRIILEAGDIFSNVTKRPTNSFEVATNTAVASVKGTQFGASSENYFWVGEGIVTLTSLETGQIDTLLQQMYGLIKPNGEIETGRLSDEELQQLYEKYKNIEDKLQANSMNLIFRNNQGQTKKVKVDYFKNN